MQGTSVMFLYFTFPTRTSRWSDRHGSNPSISPEVPYGLLVQLTGLQARTPVRFHARRNCKRVPRGGHLPEESHSDANRSLYMQHNHPCIYLSHCFLASGSRP